MIIEDLQHPEVMITAAEVIGNISAWKMPFNVQNAIGNWLMLVGQAIVTFNAQQQLCMGGAGKCFCELQSEAESTAAQPSTVAMEQQIKDLTQQVRELQQIINQQQSGAEWQLLHQICLNLQVSDRNNE